MKIFASIFILFFGYNLVSACSCQVATDEQKDKAIIDSPVIFQGKVVSIEKSWLNPANDHKIKFQVLRAWKGIEVNEIVIETPNHPAGCGYSFQEGSTYTVYSTENPRFTNTAK